MHTHLENITLTTLCMCQQQAQASNATTVYHRHIPPRTHAVIKEEGCSLSYSREVVFHPTQSGSSSGSKESQTKGSRGRAQSGYGGMHVSFVSVSLWERCMFLSSFLTLLLSP